MALDLYKDSDNPVAVDELTNPLTGDTDIADATVTVTLYASNKTDTVAGAVGLSAAWNSTISAYVAVIPDAVALTLGALYYVKVLIDAGSNRRIKWVPAKVIDT